MLRYHCWMLMNFYPKGAIEIPEDKAPVEITEALIRKVENDAEYRIHESACMVLADVLAITEGAEDPGAAAFEIVKRYKAMVKTRRGNRLSNAEGPIFLRGPAE